MKDLQLEFSLDAPQAEKSVKQPEIDISEKHAVLLELPTLKAKLEYYNKNICSLALVRQVATYEEVELPTTDATTAQNGFTKSKELRLLPSVYYTPPFDLCTETDEAIFEPLRQKEIERLQAELNRRKTYKDGLETELDKREIYKEQLEYIVTQPGFDLHDNLDVEEIGLHPSGRTPEEIAEFNAVAQKEFEKKLPTEYHNLLFEREKAALSMQLSKAFNPKKERNLFLKAIEKYTFCEYPEPDVWKFITQNNQYWEEEKEFSLKYLKRIVQQTFVRANKGKDPNPDTSKKPFNSWEWAAWKHGQQMFELYKWLKDWKPGQTEEPPKTKAEEGNNYTRSTIEDYLEQFKDIMTPLSYRCLIEALLHYLEKGKFPIIKKDIILNGRPGKYRFGWAINRIFDAQGKGITTELLRFAQQSISLYKDCHFEENNFRHSNLYKYFTKEVQ